MKSASLIFSLFLSINSSAKCTGDNLEDFAPSKFTVYQTDREHKFVGKTTPLVFSKEEDELSENNKLYHISHHKDLNKACALHSTPDSTFSLKAKEDFVVKAIESNKNGYRLVLDHAKLAFIDCKGIKTMGDLRDTLEPYLTFSCKDRFKPKTLSGRLPASVR
ncbi:MAG: hypothetical protein ACOYL6_06545 [Bacteriovoracaceae bacterium]